MKNMDPWNSCQGDVTVFNPVSLKFEDNFSPTISQTLPDSDQYLATLESKLKKIKNDPNLLKQLAERRETCMQQLLDEKIVLEDNLDLEAPIAQFKNFLSPRQALNQGEIVNLIKHDELGSTESLQNKTIDSEE